MDEDVEDLVSLTVLDTDTILKTLRKRHMARVPYTMCNSVCVSVNPHKWLPLYTSDIRTAYMHGSRKHAHPYLLTARAVMGVRVQQSQTLVVTGESGAGKTEMARICLDFVRTFGDSEHSSPQIERILRAGEVLEYVGNAQTVRNANSSRFGKFLRLYFRNGFQVGASVQTYLLERGRILNPSSDEGTFRIVYALFEDRTIRDTYALHAVDRSVFGKHQAAHPSTWDDFQAVARIAGFDESNNAFIASVVSGVTFLLTRDLASAAQIFGVNTSSLTQVLSHRRTVVQNETLWTECSTEEVKLRCKALAMGLYARMFDRIVSMLNDFIGGSREGTTLNVLDIFGFEALGVNGLEQLCINYCNERIQTLFIDDVIVQQQLEYANEGVECSHIEFDTNTRVVDLCERVMFPLLDEALRLRMSGEGLIDSINAHRPTAFSVPLVRSTRPIFTIEHYAARVTYSADIFIERNSDELRSEIIECMTEASHPEISSLFQSTERVAADRKIWTTSITAAFSEQMKTLLGVIERTQTLYVRCIRPNESSNAVEFDNSVVEQQISANGILHACKVMRNGYEHRMTHETFAKRFPRINKEGVIFGDRRGHWGKTMVYLNDSLHDEMRYKEACEVLRAHVSRVASRIRVRNAAVMHVQRHVRAWICGRRTTRLDDAIILIQRRIRRHHSLSLARWRQFDEMQRLKAHIVELRREMKRKDQWIFRATQALRKHRPDLFSSAPTAGTCVKL